MNKPLVTFLACAAVILVGCNKEPAQPEPPATAMDPTAIKILQDLGSPLAEQEINVQKLRIHAGDHGIYMPEKRASAKRIEI